MPTLPPSDRLPAPPSPDDPDRTDPGPDLGPPAPAGGSAVLAAGGGAATDLFPAPDTASLPPLPPPGPLRRYRLGDEIARGGMGVVFQARDTRLGREVAAKVLLEAHQKKPELHRRFDDEARITGRLEHPGIVPIYELGRFPDGRPYYTMRLVKGETLESLLDRRTCPADDRPRFLKVFERACQAVAYAHSEGVIHRDLKPSNIMVAPFGVVTVMDWGVAKVIRGPEPGCPADLSALPPADARETPASDESAVRTRLGRVLGTPAYMAPEQARGEIDRLDERTDVFGLGGILCAILTGQPPYPGDDGRAVYKMATRADLDDVHRRLDLCGADQELVALARRCLAPDPADRPPDATSLAAEFTAYLESALRRAERDLERFFELSLDLFCIAGFNGYFRRVNGNFTRVLGFSTGDLLARPFIDLVHPDDRAKTWAEVGQLSRGLPMVRFRNRYRDARGEYHCLEWTAQGVPEEGVIFAVGRDVTDQPGQSPCPPG